MSMKIPQKEKGKEPWAKGLHNEPHPTVQTRHLAQDLIGPHSVPQSGLDLQVGPLGPDWVPPATLSGEEITCTQWH